MRINVPYLLPKLYTHEGAQASRIMPEQALRRSVMSCMLWEKEFYEEGRDIVLRLTELVLQVDHKVTASIACEARNVAHLRHVPLLLTSLLAQFSGRKLVEELVPQVIRRADELTELVAIHAKLNNTAPDKVKRHIPAAMKRGLAKAFTKFNEYALAKYDRDNGITLRDVLFMCHAKPRDEEQAEVWKRLIAGTLARPNTWESALVGGADKKETFERLLREGNLGYLALLRNLRGMVNASVDLGLIRNAVVARKGSARVLPFRYVAAARACPQLEPEIDSALCESIATGPRLSGKTIVLVDVSGSMESQLSSKSDLKRMDAAAALASVIHAEDLRVFSFSNLLAEVPPRRGMAGVDAVIKSQPHQGTQLGAAIRALPSYDRLIVITDEQSHDKVPPPSGKGYMINVASAKNGVGYGAWTHIDGFSENILRYITEIEAKNDA